MKKHILSLLALVITASTVFSQTPDTQAGENQIINGKREGHWRITAALKHLGSPWTPQQLVEEGNYTASMKVGIWFEYFFNGNKKSELTYVNNRPNGPAKIYFENGQLQEEGTWVGTRWTGNYTLYYPDGKVRQQFKYNALGVRDGEQLYYHPNGQLAIKANIKNGKEEGLQQEYNTNGELIKETYYNGGVIDDKKTVVHEPKKAENPNAAVTPEERDNNKEVSPVVKPGDGNESNAGAGKFTGTGPWTMYNTDKQVTLKGEFKDWRLVKGEERIYDRNGKCIRVKMYDNGRYVGDGPLPKEDSGK